MLENIIDLIKTAFVVIVFGITMLIIVYATYILIPLLILGGITTVVYVYFKETREY